MGGNLTARLVIMEDAKTLPFGAVWDFHCLQEGVPADGAWLPIVEAYERDVLQARR
jgi:L-rhamnose isomerase